MHVACEPTGEGTKRLRANGCGNDGHRNLRLSLVTWSTGPWSQGATADAVKSHPPRSARIVPGMMAINAPSQ
eukprot:10526645-Alexandrium_andersonii.AAC.1